MPKHILMPTPCHKSRKYWNLSMALPSSVHWISKAAIGNLRWKRIAYRKQHLWPLQAYLNYCVYLLASNSAASFQRLMETVLRDLKGKCCLVYIDDVVVYSKNEEEHMYDLTQVFKYLHNAGLTLNLGKCNFMQRNITYLGHNFSRGS